MNKSLSLFMLVMHLVMAIVSFISANSGAYVHNESFVCKAMFPLNHLLYAAINLILMVAFLFILVSSSANDLSFLDQTTAWGAFMLGLGFYSIFLKHLTDSSCQFWTVSWAQCLGHLLQFAVEGIFLICFYDWYSKKVKFLRSTMRSSAQDLI